MDNQQPSSTINFSTPLKQQEPQKTVAHLLEDRDALNDWVTNIEKIRKMESDGVTKRAS